MREIFNETFEKEKMPDISKRRVRNNLLQMFDEEQKHAKKRVLGRYMALVCSLAVIMVSGVTVIAGNSNLRESIAERVRGLFVSKDEAVNQVYKDKNVEEYIHIIEENDEKSSFDEEKLQLQLVSYMGDTNGIQILLQYAVNENIPHAYPSAEMLQVSGSKEAYILDQSWITSDDNHGYWIIYVSAEAEGSYTLCVENFLWGSQYFEGTYTANFSVNSNQVTNMYHVNRNYTLDFEGKNPKEIQVQSIGLSPVACTISVKMPENFSVNEAFNLILNPYENLDRDDLYFIDRNGKKCDIKGRAAFCSMWETNGEFDSYGCALASEGAETTLLILFENAVDIEQISGVCLVGADVIFK